MKAALAALALLPMVSALDCAENAITGDAPDRLLTLTPGCDNIPNTAFNMNQDFDLVEIPNTVTTIGQSAFGQTALREVVIPESVTTIQYNAFFATPLTTVTFNAVPASIDGQAFGVTNSLTDVYVPAGTDTTNLVSLFHSNPTIQEIPPATCADASDATTYQSMGCCKC